MRNRTSCKQAFNESFTCCNRCELKSQYCQIVSLFKLHQMSGMKRLAAVPYEEVALAGAGQNLGNGYDHTGVAKHN